MITVIQPNPKIEREEKEDLQWWNHSASRLRIDAIPPITVEAGPLFDRLGFYVRPVEGMEDEEVAAYVMRNILGEIGLEKSFNKDKHNHHNIFRENYMLGDGTFVMEALIVRSMFLHAKEYLESTVGVDINRRAYGFKESMSTKYEISYYQNPCTHLANAQVLWLGHRLTIDMKFHSGNKYIIESDAERFGLKISESCANLFSMYGDDYESNEALAGNHTGR